MRKLIMLLSLFTLVGCGEAKVTEAEKQMKLKEQAWNKENQRLIKIVAKADREALTLIRKGQQGCLGKILNDDEINAAVVGKVKRGGGLFKSSIVYHPYGVLKHSSPPAHWGGRQYGSTVIGKYWINKDKQLCDDVTRLGQYPHCARLIRTADNNFMEESGVLDGSTGRHLTYLTMELNVLDEKNK